MIDEKLEQPVLDTRLRPTKLKTREEVRELLKREKPSLTESEVEELLDNYHQEKPGPAPAHRVKHHQMAYYPKGGRVWNPLRDWPRNYKCFCGSGKKAKSCCLPKVEATVTPQDAAELRKLVAKAVKLHEATKGMSAEGRDTFLTTLAAQALIEEPALDPEQEAKRREFEEYQHEDATAEKDRLLQDEQAVQDHMERRDPHAADDGQDIPQ